MPELILVKHSLPDIRPERPRREWRLSDEGRVLAARLAERIRIHNIALIATSPEPKAAETARALAEALGITSVQTLEGLREHDDGDVPFQDETIFRASVRRFFAHPTESVFGPESADAAHKRFSAEVEALLPSSDGGSIVAVAHGRVISLFVSRRNSLDPYSLWERLGLPSFVILELPTYGLVKVVDGV